MATAPIEVAPLYTGLGSPTLELYPFGSDTIAVAALTLTEATNRKGLYSTTTTAGLTGWHHAIIKVSTQVIAVGIVYMTNDTTIHRVKEQASDGILIDGKTIQEAMQTIAAMVGGKCSGAGSGTELFYGMDGTTLRATITGDSSGNRTLTVYA